VAAESGARPKGAAILGVAIGNRTLEALVDEAMEAIRNGGRPAVFACANPHSLVAANADETFFRALSEADPVVADGSGVALVGKVLRADIGPRITGSDYFLGVMGRLEALGGGRVFFFGSSERVLGLIAGRLGRDFPSLTLCGTLSPPFREFTEQENLDMVAAINAARPDVLWVGMTAPKQEKWVYRNRSALAVPVVGSIGAVFDFYAGTHPRAPAWMCRLGIEWLYRLVREPRRMWRRNFVSTPAFLGLVLWRDVLGFGNGPR
jgi:N-acetylglucosaminyldiphosphoundecaprenol N-acetyl-beta-D-mannosaminyltransferase